MLRMATSGPAQRQVEQGGAAIAYTDHLQGLDISQKLVARIGPGHFMEKFDDKGKPVYVCMKCGASDHGALECNKE